MKRLVASLALALAPFGASCASSGPLVSAYVANFCRYGHEWGAWRLTDAPPNAEALRGMARTDDGAVQEIPEGAREYWFAAPGGEIKYCLTAMTTTGRHFGCDYPLGVWWVFRETANGQVTDGGQFRTCLS